LIFQFKKGFNHYSNTPRARFVMKASQNQERTLQVYWYPP